MAVSSCVNTPAYTATSWPHLTHIDKDLHAGTCQVGGVLWGERMPGICICICIADNTP